MRDSDIAGGTAHLEIYFPPVTTPITSVSFDFCSDLGVSCPLTKGDAFTATLSYRLPKLPLPWLPTIRIDATFLNVAGVELDCYTLMVGKKQLNEFKVDDDRDVYNGTLPEVTARYLFAKWREQFPHITIKVAEEEMRYLIFKSNFETIISHDMKTNQNEDDSGYTMGMNEFGHLTWREFKAMYVGGIRSNVVSNQPRQQHVIPSNFTAPKGGVDWSKKGVSFFIY